MAEKDLTSYNFELREEGREFDTLLILLVRLGVGRVCRSQATVQPRNQPPGET